MKTIKAINRREYDRREKIYLVSYRHRQEKLGHSFGQVQVLAKNKREAVDRFSLGDRNWLKDTIRIEGIKAV